MPSFSTYFICVLSVLSAEAHGPHHPRGGHHHHHRATDSATKLTQDEQLLQDKEYVMSFVYVSWPFLFASVMVCI